MNVFLSGCGQPGDHQRVGFSDKDIQPKYVSAPEQSGEG